MESQAYIPIAQYEITNAKSMKIALHSEAVANGKLIIPKWLIPVIIVVLVLVMLGSAFSMGYFISYPRSSVKSLKLYNEVCTVLSKECDDTRGLFCPAGLCACQTKRSVYNGSYCVCQNLTLFANQECMFYPGYGEWCQVPSVPCRSNFMCNATNVCVCNSTSQFYNGSYCITQFAYNSTCTQTSQCANVSNLQCIANRCDCSSDSFWNGTTCVSKKLGWQTCNNRTSGPTALPCDNTLGLYCHSNATCQCPNTMFWEINDQTCETKRMYGDICNGDFYCNETLNFICPPTPGTCNCPSWSNDYTCDCRPNWFYDGFQCTQRGSINATCEGTYACDRNTTLVCFSGLCVCPTPTTWGTTDCVCPTGQTWSGSACVTTG